MKNLLVTLEADWLRFKGRDEIKVMRKYAIHGRNFTLSYTGELSYFLQKLLKGIRE